MLPNNHFDSYINYFTVQFNYSFIRKPQVKSSDEIIITIGFPLEGE